jgi:hypothetical protein
MLIEDVAIYLMQQSIGNYDREGITGDIFINTLPSQDNVIGLYSRGGVSAEVANGYDNPAIQIIVRGAADHNPFEALARAQSIYDALHGAFDSDPIIAGGIVVINCMGLQSGPTSLGKDSNNRHEYSLNFQFEVVNNINIKRG